MRACAQVVGAANVMVLAAAVGVAAGGHLMGSGEAKAAVAAADRGERRSPPPHDRVAAVPAAGDVRRPSDGDGSANDDGEADSSAGAAPRDGRVDSAAPDARREPEMGWAAKVVAACESGERRGHGMPVLGSHRWDATNQHGGTDSGAFQFLDSTWRWVAGEIGATQDARAKDAPPRVQLRAFRWLWRRDRSNWDASRSCWAPLLRR